MKRPWTVLAGCMLSLAISATDLVWALLDDELREVPAFVALLLVLSLLPVIFTVAALFRRNWGRILLAITTVIALLAVPVSTIVFDASLGTIDAETVLYAVADVAVVVLLYLPLSNRWYRELRAAPAVVA